MSEHVTQRVPPIGRQEEKEAMAQAIRGQGPQILFLEGVAGIGKTVLLEEGGRIAREQGALCLPTIDFYDTSVHSHQVLEAAIAQYLNPDREAFAEYWEERKKNPQAELWEPFLAGYGAAVGDRHVVFRFDTAERLEYERDSPEVLDDCEVKELDAPSWEWLLRRIGNLPQTTVFIAARPTPTGLLRQRLLDAHGDRVLVLEIAGFSLEETEAYFQATEFGRQVVDKSPEMVEKTDLLADGRPILIALALDWLARGMWDPRLYPVSVARLRAWKTQAQAEEEACQRGEMWRQWHETRQRFEALLVEQIRRLASPLDVAVRYVALCRKGCNAELLARLMNTGGTPVDDTQAQQLVEELLDLSFVKPPRPGSYGLFFLHDEMYNLVEKYVWLVDWPDYREQERLDDEIIGWYDEQISMLSDSIRAVQVQDWREKNRLRREQQLLMTERLHYQFDADPRLGYREYSHLSEEAIAARELEWSIWLRNEALWFTSNRAWRKGKPDCMDPEYPRNDPAWLKNGTVIRSPAVDHDCRRRWVNRYIARNEYETAARVARHLLVSPVLPNEPELYRGGVQVGLATAQAYMGGEFTQQALQNFDTGIRALEMVDSEHQEPWLYPFLLGSAYLYKGLALRGALSLQEATAAYSRAVHYFRQIGYRPGQAEATNNLSYVLARRGRLGPALTACNEGLRIRQELGDEYNIALSLNTKGIICERMNRPITAIHSSEQALTIFEEKGEERGLVLALISLGRAYRRKARSPEWGHQDEDFELGAGYLERAIDLQERQGDNVDAFYRVESINELGCLYRDWVATLHEKGKEDDRVKSFLDEAENLLQNAIALTKEATDTDFSNVAQYVDSLEDLAGVHYWRHKANAPCNEGDPLDIMKGLLDRAQRGAEEGLARREELRLILGKLYFQRARLAVLQNKAKDQIAQDYALAVGYAESYSLDAPEAHKFASEGSEWLSELDPAEAKKCVLTMHDALHETNLRSVRLRENVESIVQPLFGIDWPSEEAEAPHG